MATKRRGKGRPFKSESARRAAAARWGKGPGVDMDQAEKSAPSTAEDVWAPPATATGRRAEAEWRAMREATARRIKAERGDLELGVKLDEKLEQAPPLEVAPQVEVAPPAGRGAASGSSAIGPAPATEEVPDASFERCQGCSLAWPRSESSWRRVSHLRERRDRPDLSDDLRAKYQRCREWVGRPPQDPREAYRERLAAETKRSLTVAREKERARAEGILAVGQAVQPAPVAGIEVLQGTCSCCEWTYRVRTGYGKDVARARHLKQSPQCQAFSEDHDAAWRGTVVRVSLEEAEALARVEPAPPPPGAKPARRPGRQQLVTRMPHRHSFSPEPDLEDDNGDRLPPPGGIPPEDFFSRPD